MTLKNKILSVSDVFGTYLYYTIRHNNFSYMVLDKKMSSLFLMNLDNYMYYTVHKTVIKKILNQVPVKKRTFYQLDIDYDWLH